jgi:cytochrome c oxidase subunit 2
MPRARNAALILTCCVVVASCAGDHHVMDPKGPEATRIAGIGWFMVVTATVISVVFLGLLAYGLIRGGRHRWKPGDTFVVVGGIVLPMAVITALTAMGLGALDAGNPPDPVRIEVTGHQFWWEVRYVDEGFITANEFEIPVGRPVEVSLRSVDVQHSFWVPGLAGKIDMYPGRTNSLVLEAEHAGEYRGQCAEYCGLQHAQMAFFVTASPPDRYEDWVRAHAAPAPEPRTDVQRAGRDAFVSGTCGSCHTVRGTGAQGTSGPDLTHFASRRTIGSGAIPNTRGGLGGWIANSQTIKPGNEMPPIPVSPEELQGLLDYLEMLR